MATVTDYAHPLNLVALGTLAPSQTPLSYPSPPTAIPVPESPGAVAFATQQQQELAASPTAQADASTTCRSIAGSSPTATIPAFCNPSLHVNAPSLVASRSGDGAPLPTGTVQVGAVPNKIGCCAECAGLYNCVAWRFVPVYVGDPSDRLPGGFDPWGRGACDIVYHIGEPDPDHGITVDDAADRCPNGRVGDLLEGSTNPPPEDGEGGGNGTKTRSWMNVYYNGWNQGACGAPINVFEDGTDDGTGEEDTLCPK